jgi:hypothetical protein
VLPFIQTVTGLCADLAQLSGANILEGVIFMTPKIYKPFLFAFSSE